MNYRTTASILGITSAVLILLGGALAWQPDKSPQELEQRWAPPPSRFIMLDGLRVHLRDEGPRDDPVPIVLLHGTSSSLHTWDGWAAALSGQRRVIRVDLPGFALTGPNLQDDYSIDVYVRFMTAVLDHLGVQRFVVGGNSVGGQIAWSLAHALPQRAERLILVDASGYPPESGKTRQSLPLAFHLATTPGLNKLMEYTLPRGLVEYSVRDLYGDPSKVTPALVDRYVDMTLRSGNRHALVRRIDQGYIGNSDEIRSLAVPTLIIWGGKDHVVPLEFGERFQNDIKGSTLVVLSDLGHVPQEEDPARTVAAVKRFLGL